jgi:hypothetical protein
MGKKLVEEVVEEARRLEHLEKRLDTLRLWWA